MRNDSSTFISTLLVEARAATDFLPASPFARVGEYVWWRYCIPESEYISTDVLGGCPGDFEASLCVRLEGDRGDRFLSLVEFPPPLGEFLGLVEDLLAASILAAANLSCFL